MKFTTIIFLSLICLCASGAQYRFNLLVTTWLQERVFDQDGEETTISFSEESNKEALFVLFQILELGGIYGTKGPETLKGASFDQAILLEGTLDPIVKRTASAPDIPAAEDYQDFHLDEVKIRFPLVRQRPGKNFDTGFLETHFSFDTFFPDGLQFEGKKIDFTKHTAKPKQEDTATVIHGEDDLFKVLPDPNGKAYFLKGRASYHTAYLAAMKEPSMLAIKPEEDEVVFRFTYLRSFHDPIVVRLEQSDRGWTGRAVVLENDDNHRPVKVVPDEKIIIRGEDARALSKQIRSQKLWKPLSEYEEAVMGTGLDGSRWIFEIQSRKGYRLIDVWRPEAMNRFKDDPGMRDYSIYQKLGIEVLKFAKVLPKAEERY